MLQFAVCLFLILEVSSSSKTTAVVKINIGGDDLVAEVESTLGVCSAIVEAVGDFRENFDSDDVRRRLDDMDKGLVNGVQRKLDTCSAIFEAVDTGLEDYCKETEHKDENANGQPITFNVGGSRFSTSLATLRSVKNTYFEKMFREGIYRNISDDGTFFIDRSPSTFEYVLDYLRTGDLFIKSDAKLLRLHLLDDAKYFELPQEVTDYLQWKPINGIDLRLSEVAYLNGQLKLIKMKMGEVLYDASQDGDSSGVFHRLCDNKGPTVVIIQTNTGNVFGGFSSASWSSSSGYSSSSTAFLFRLRPSMKRFNIRSSSYSIYRHSGTGPRFGYTDIYIYSGALTTYSNYLTNSYYTYSSNYDLNNGERYFKVEDYAVVKAINL